MRFRIGIRYKHGGETITRYFQQFDELNNGTHWSNNESRHYQLFETEDDMRQVCSTLYSMGYRTDRTDLTLFVECKQTFWQLFPKAGMYRSCQVCPSVPCPHCGKQYTP